MNIFLPLPVVASHFRSRRARRHRCKEGGVSEKTNKKGVPAGLGKHSMIMAKAYCADPISKTKPYFMCSIMQGKFAKGSNMGVPA